jgi:hypothetical protein
MRHRALLGYALAAGLIPAAVGVARATNVIIDNNDGPGEGFNDPTPMAPVGGNPGTTLGAQRLNAFQFAANIWASLLNSPVDIRVAATFDSLPCDSMSAKLGQAGPLSFVRDFAGAPVASTWYPIALANSLAGTDLDPGNDDIGAQFNSDFGFGCAFPGSFYLGLDGNPPGLNDSDLVTVVLHELCHGLGFGTLVDLTTGLKALGFDDTFMLNLEDHSLALLWPPMSDAQRVASSIDTGDLHWVGTNVVASGGFLTAGRDPVSGHVQMFAPNPQQAGSSVNHWDTALLPNEIMEPIYTGPNHNPGLAVPLLEDLGWSVGAAASTTVTTTTTSTTITIPPGLDSYVCDKATVNTKSGGVKFDKTNLPTRSLQDEFGTDTCTFKKEDRVCPPALPGTNPTIHELSYQIVCPTPFAKTTVHVQDAIGSPTITLLKKADVLAPSGKIDLGPVPPPPPQIVPAAPPALTVDHYLCYKVKGPTFKPPVSIGVSDQFYPGGYPGPTLKKMTKFCTPVNKNDEDPTAPTHPGRLTCYQMKLAKGSKFNKTNVSTNNTNFGAQVLQVTGTAEVCLAAVQLP